MSRNGFAWALILVIAAVAVVGIVYFIGAGQWMSERTPITKPPVEVNHTRYFNASFITGYEGYFSQISYNFSYPDNVFSVSSSPDIASQFSLFNLEDGGASNVSIFNNDAAGFSSSRELFQAQNFCPSCHEMAPGAPLRNATGSVAFTNGSRTWVIFADGPGFVIANLAEPSIDTQIVLASLQFSSFVVNRPGGGTTFKVYFFNNSIKQANECNEVVAVSRSVPKTSAVATSALNDLLAGPLPTEKYDGYYSAIPAGSKLNSLTVTNGVAYADFNAATESSGGSCSMRAITSQIQQTLLQFPTVKSVTLSVNGNSEAAFQP